MPGGINSKTGQYYPVRKKGDLTGAGKGDWQRFKADEKYKENYDKIFGKRDILVENRIVAKK